MIEKNIFQIWKDDNIPFYLKSFVNSWKKQKGFSYHLHTDVMMDKYFHDNYPDFIPVYNKMKVVERTDLYRLILVYKYGGIYSDLDTTCNTNLLKFWDEFCDADVVVGVEADDEVEKCREFGLARNYQLCNWTFAAKKGNSIIKEIIDRVIDNCSSDPNLDTLEKTGPANITDVTLKYKDDQSVCILPIQYFGSGQKHSLSPKSKKGVIIHHFLGSWKRDVSWSKKVRFRINSWFIN